MTIEEMEARLDLLREDHDLLLELIEFKGIEMYNVKTAAVVNLHFPLLKRSCFRLIESAASHTELNGHNARVDYVKDKAFEIYGKTVGENLT